MQRVLHGVMNLAQHNECFGIHRKIIMWERYLFENDKINTKQFICVDEWQSELPFSSVK